MKALLLRNSILYIKDYARPVPNPDEVLIKVLMAGICNTDLALKNGYMDFQGILGHEFVGIVEECGSNKGEKWIGKRVVGEINCVCGKCEYCLNGLERHCSNRTVLGILNRDGAFAKYLTLPIRNLHIVPDNVSDEEAVFTEPLAAALEILEQIHIMPNTKVVVLGDGKLGLLVAQVLAKTGCELLLVGKHISKLKIARRWCLHTNLASLLEESFYADIVVDCTGSRRGFAIARSLVHPRGTIIIKSTFKDLVQMDLSSLVVDEITLIGSRCGPFAPALTFLQQKQIFIKELITQIYPLENILDAFHKAEMSSSLKILVKI